MARKSSSKRSSRKRTSRSKSSAGKRSFKKVSFYAGPRSAFEKKFIDNSLTIPCNNGGAITVGFFNCAQGNAPNQRIGNKITVTNINMRGYVSGGTVNNVAGTIDEVPQFRMIIALDKQANGAAPSAFGLADGLLQNQTGNYDPAVNPQWNMLQYRNMFNLDRFTILKDKIIRPLAAGSSGAASRIDMPVPFKFSWKGQLPVLYSTADANTAAIRSNNLVVLFVSDKTMTASTAHANIEMCTRVKYIDA